MTTGLTLMLLTFSGVAFAGAGAALAILRSRVRDSGDRDLGLVSVVVMLVLFGSLCALLGGGVGAIFGFGGVVLWASYVFTAQRIGLFRVETLWEASAEHRPGEAWSERRR